MNPTVRIRRRVGWIDTDAAGIWHHSTLIRWAEDAEAQLHRELGVIDATFGATPRVRIDFTFRTPIRFDDEVDITLTVTELGRTSIRYFTEAKRDGETVASGNMVAVLIDRETGLKTPWPDHLRQVLSPDEA
jgi:YbgC/YbaW family acyl-CoA thioester hydrolase